MHSMKNNKLGPFDFRVQVECSYWDLGLGGLGKVGFGLGFGLGVLSIWERARVPTTHTVAGGDPGPGLGGSPSI